MPVYIELTTDAFEATFQRQAAATRSGGNKTGGAGKKNVRRPMRGIEIKEDTYAIVKVVRSDGREIPLFDSSSQDGLSSDGYANFLLQTVQEARMEKHQIVETFGDSFIFFFGENPHFVDCTAILLNSNDFNWVAEWDQNYDKYLRGTKLVEMGARLYLFYNDVVLEGYMLSTQKLTQVQQPYHVGIQFRLFITNFRNMSFVDAPDNAKFPQRASVSIPESIDLTSTGAAEDLINAYRGAALEDANTDSADRSALSLLRTFDTGENPFVSGARITDLIRSMPRSFAVSEEVWTDILNNPDVNQNLKNLVVRNGTPIRGLISDNTDEYTGIDTGNSGLYDDSDGTNPRPPDAQAGTVRSQLEIDDFFRTAIEALSCYGADINSPDAFSSLGIGISFGDTSGSSFGSVQVGSSDQFSQFSKDPLNSVYGSDADQFTLGPTSNPEYGYPGDYADGEPGYGVVGYGDMGGDGFGSGLGEAGDPGFKDPSEFTFAGVADARGAYERFTKPRDDTTSFGGGSGSSVAFFGAVNTGAVVTGSNGASVGVGGPLTAFSFSAVSGSLDPTGNSRSDLNVIADRLAQTKFGFSIDNPFGVNCAPRSDDVGGSDLNNPYV